MVGVFFGATFFAAVFLVGAFFTSTFLTTVGLTGSTLIVRVTDGPVAVPVAAVGVKVRTFDAAAERRRVASAPFGTVKRTSLLPARRFAVPSEREPSVAVTSP